jgi:hypothetical protein
MIVGGTSVRDKRAAHAVCADSTIASLASTPLSFWH